MKKTAAVVAGVIMALGAATPAFADADAQAVSVGSGGFLSGNVIQVPIHAAINLCGNSVNLIGALSSASGNVCVNA